MVLLALPFNVNNKEKCGVVELVAYMVDSKKNHTLQFVPLLKPLQQMVNCKVIFDKIVENHIGQQDIELDLSCDFRLPQDGLHVTPF